VEVAASTLYEAAVLAIAQFRNWGFTSNAPGPRRGLVQWSKIETWLQSAGKPNEQVMKGRFRELLRG